MGYFSADGALYRRRAIFRICHIFYSFLPSVISRVAGRRARGEGLGERCEEIARVICLRYRLTDERTYISSLRNTVPRKHAADDLYLVPASRSLSRCSDGARFAFALHETLQNSK